ncbi:MAG: transporter substrate-binding domain-containing protein [Gemmatimonadaceae bacterium]|nr:transporter substrate-binding domain-containing protein [Gemmatimonadaceae bacterium]NUO94982.1 transporter substrate-binding domain-containing protein [Gemmatimonadaceae bacterium]NUP57787.1 transporter substrate-binding domain-containing protein [Gemmatimonadaceae bacterium]NUP71888.1 transporter substrate-binding domain-containing protein [Gemmatimonadaceae bacterium]NUR35656.1 transporter substrate-binding domain-containing protein [Gemmatimonadaceae bacterium]
MPMPPTARALRVCCCLAALASCGLPRDSDHTLDRIRGGELRVGVTEHAPWVTVRDDRMDGIEPRLIEELARGLGARTVWRRGAEAQLLEALHRRELDIVAGGLTADSPWKGQVALTRPYFTDTTTGRTRVLAVSPGENAFLVHVERFLAPRERRGGETPDVGER